MLDLRVSISLLRALREPPDVRNLGMEGGAAGRQDPRTGVSTEFPRGLPNVGQIRDFCDVIVRRMDVLSKPKPVAAQYVPPPVLPGQITYGEFLARVATGELKHRPIGRFEREPL